MIFKELKGCDLCFTEKSYCGKRPLKRIADLYDSNHYSLTLFFCPRCGTYFLSRFFEVVDIGGGNDLMFSSLTPISEAEHEHLKALFANASSKDAGISDAETIFCSRHGLMMGPRDEGFSWMSEAEVNFWQTIGAKFGG